MTSLALSILLWSNPTPAKPSKAVEQRRQQVAERHLTEVQVPGEDLGGQRSAWVHVPDGPGPWPVVLAFHGGRNNSGLNMAPRLEPVFDEDVLLVFPNGGNRPPMNTGWIGPGFEQWGNDPTQDIRYVYALIDALAQRWDIDREHVYATGFSNGGYMTQVLWCNASDLIKGAFIVGSVFAKPVAAQCNPTQHHPIGIMVGSADRKLAADHNLSLSETTDLARQILGCKRKSTTTTLPDRGDQTEVTHTVWAKCDEDLVVELFEIENGGHFWPGHGSDDPHKSRDVSATEQAFRFLHERAGLPQR